MSILKYTISLLLLLATMGKGFAQSGIDQWIPSSIRVGGAVDPLGYLIFSDKRNYFEATADIDFNRFFLVYDYGYNHYKLNEPTYVYSNKGRYMRLGPDVNFMSGDKQLNVGFFGFRYAWSSFQDELSYNTKAVIESDIKWPNTREEVSNIDGRSHWFEMVAGLKVRVYRHFFMGFTARYKFLIKVKVDGSLKPYWVPGFGKLVNQDSWGLNYYIYYNIPFRKKIYFEKSEKIKK